jgi:hypothetical protein
MPVIPVDPERKTIIVNGRLAMREERLSAARACRHGLQIMSFEQMVTRLAGGFSRSVDDETLSLVIQAALEATELGELDKIKSLPGMVDAAAGTLRKIWLAGIDLDNSGAHSRLASLAALEAAVLARLPAGMLYPEALMLAAMRRLKHARAVLGAVEIVGITELAPIWRPLLFSLSRETEVTWNAGPRSVPSWLQSEKITVRRAPPQSPGISTVSAATTYHEAVEAMRWARQLLASGQAKPADIAFAATSPTDYDEHFLSLRDDANIDVHFVHGTAVTASRDGQAAAALADVLIRGLSQNRLRRLANHSPAFARFPVGWMRLIPADAPLATPIAWERVLGRLSASDWPDGIDHSGELRDLIARLAQGTEAATEAGETFLSGRALTIWRKALLAGPAPRLDMTIETLKEDDSLDACVSIAWMPASALAASPRRFVRLLGLNSTRWPRSISEDRLLSDHIIPTAQLDPLPVNSADRRDFATILCTTESSVVLSRARRDGDGRLLGRSPLLTGQPAEAFLRRNAVPTHAFSEGDRLMARPAEFAVFPQTVSAKACWRDWHSADITAHDGLIRPDHPVMLSILNRRQSASSFRRLLRNPLGFVWQYGLHWRTPDSGVEPLVLDALAFGALVHAVIDTALQTLQAQGGLAGATREQTLEAIVAATAHAGALWEAEQAVPPPIIWRRSLHDVTEMAGTALTYDDRQIPDAQTYSEVPFGGSAAKSAAELPWDPELPVEIPGTGFHIGGYIDRIDISKDKTQAAVRDYKTGRMPKEDIVLDGGKELQRCLYAFAVKALLGADVAVRSSLFYPREEAELPLENPEATLAEISQHLRAARASFQAGKGLIGPDAGDDYDDLGFALPANAKAGYCRRKRLAAQHALGDAAEIWDAK